MLRFAQTQIEEDEKFRSELLIAMALFDSLANLKVLAGLCTLNYGKRKVDEQMMAHFGTHYSYNI